MLQSLFILDSSGYVACCGHLTDRAIVIEKHYRGIVSRQIAEQFWDEVQKVSPFFSELLPVIATAKYYLIHILRGVYQHFSTDTAKEGYFSLV